MSHTKPMYQKRDRSNRTQKLLITVTKEFERAARILAANRRQHLSDLFEDLLRAELAKGEALKEVQDLFGPQMRL